MNEAVLVQPDLLTDVINQESDDSLTESGPPDDFVCQGLGSLACATCPAADRCRELQMNGLEAEAPKSGLSDLLADDDKTIWADNYDPNLVDADSINIFDYATKQQSSSEIDDSPKNLQSVEDKPDVAPEPSSKIEENEPVDQTAESEYAQIDESPEGVIVDNNEANKKLVVSPEDRTEGAQAHPASELEELQNQSKTNQPAALI
ncbi:hypothetical protein CR969_01410 [Candidatus Saccharibacteria bacterium]|nr:MAG: hypothetical protein CR969_01410 [Candidatus Saccharibacteria bacterium]